jgi:hypothetical protein
MSRYSDSSPGEKNGFSGSRTLAVSPPRATCLNFLAVESVMVHCLGLENEHVGVWLRGPMWGRLAGVFIGGDDHRDMTLEPEADVVGGSGERCVSRWAGG